MSKASPSPAQANQLWKRLEDIKHLKIDLAAPGVASTSKGRFILVASSLRLDLGACEPTTPVQNRFDASVYGNISPGMEHRHVRVESSPPHDEHHMMDVEEPHEVWLQMSRLRLELTWTALFWSWPTGSVSTSRARASPRTQRDWLYLSVRVTDVI